MMVVNAVGCFLLASSAAAVRAIELSLAHFFVLQASSRIAFRIASMNEKFAAAMLDAARPVPVEQ